MLKLKAIFIDLIIPKISTQELKLFTHLSDTSEIQSVDSSYHLYVIDAVSK